MDSEWVVVQLDVVNATKRIPWVDILQEIKQLSFNQPNRVTG